MRIVYHHRTRATDAQRVHILEIVRAFEKLHHEVDLVSLVPTTTGQDDAQRDAGDAWWKRFVRRIPGGYELVQLGYNLVGLPMLLAQLLRRKAAFIYERYSLFNFTGVLAAKLMGLPIVLEVNSPFALEQARDQEIRWGGLAQWTERAICGMATHIVVVSTPLQRILISAGVSPEKIHVMPNGVNLENFRPGIASPELRRKLGLEDTTVIGFVGWFRKWHGLEMLLDAFRISGLRGRAKVLLVGGGQAMADLQEYVRSTGMDNDVVFSGPVPHADVSQYVDLIDIAVQPAANEYCCPMKILEYLALAKPIVAPRQENILELLEDGREAQFFTPGDATSMAGALWSLATEARKAQEMGRRGRAAIERRGYLWTRNAERVLQLVRKESRQSELAGAVASAAAQPGSVQKTQ